MWPPKMLSLRMWMHLISYLKKKEIRREYHLLKNFDCRILYFNFHEAVIQSSVKKDYQLIVNLSENWSSAL